MKDINATVIVDLTQSEEDIVKNLHRDARRGIGRAKRENLIVEQTNQEEDWQDFYKIYKETVIEGGTTARPLGELIKNSEILFVCRKDQKIVAAAAIWFADLYNKGVPRLYFNASLKEYQKLYPNNLLFWNCILWSKKNGYNKFDLGGWQINAKGHLIGINKFKERWGKVVLYKKEYSLPRALGRKLIRNFSLFNWLNKKIKGRK